VKVRGWHIDGFGVLHDNSASELPDGLSVVFGPNEAGKTTLLAFLQGVLFGFPRGRSDENRYRPVVEGRHGGRVEIEGMSGRLVIDRDAGGRQAIKVTRPDGQPAAEADLRAELGGVDERLFRTVFAFGLGELQAFGTIPDQEVRDRILSAAITGADRSARTALSELEARAEPLFRARGGTIRDLLAALTATQARLSEAIRASAAHADLVAEEARIKDQIATLGRTIEAARAELNEKRLLLQCWPDFQALTDAQRELAELIAVVEFPPDPEGALAAANQTAASAASALREVRAAQAATERAMREVVVDAALAAIADDLDMLNQRLPGHRELLGGIAEAHRRADEANDRIVELLTVLGSAWNEDRLAADPGEPDWRDEVADWRRRLDAVAADVAGRSADVASTASRIDELKHDRAEIKQHVQALEVPAEPPARPELEARHRAIRQLRDALGAFHEADRDAASRDLIVAERERVLADGDQTALGSIIPRWLSPVAVVVTVAAIGAAAGRSLVGDLIGTIAFGLLAGGAQIVSLGARVISYRLAQHQQLGDRTVTVRRIALDDAIRAREEGRNRLATLRADLAVAASGLGFEEPPSDEAIDGLDAALAKDESARDRWDELLAQLVTNQERLTAAESARSELEQALQDAESAQSEVQAAWAAWQRHHGPPAVLTPDELVEFLERAGSGQALLAERRSQLDTADRLEHEAADWEERARTVVVASGVTIEPTPAERLTGNALVTALLEVRARSLEDRRARAMLARFQDALLRREPEIAAAEQAVARAEAARRALFESVGVSDEAGFRERLAIHRRQTALRTTIRELEARLIGRLGQGGEAEVLRVELGRGRDKAWATAVGRSATTVERTTSARDAEVRHQRDVEAQRIALEQASDIAAISLEIETLRTELTRQLDAWRTATVAGRLVSAAHERLVRERRPEVIGDASRLFQSMTLGRYTGIEQDADGKGLSLVQPGGGRRAIGELSRGTSEQLYLALRLGLVASHARAGRALPVVMDDVLVNFDAARASAIVGLLTDFTREHQVLLFTCHETTLAAVRRQVPDVRVINLEAPPPTAPPRPRRAAPAATPSGASVRPAGVRPAGVRSRRAPGSVAT
jgi:uncharacterized protein YhaN